MGKLDVKVLTEFILRETGQTKLTLMGFSMGSAQIFYALATE